jgi:hypothetical protein
MGKAIEYNLKRWDKHCLYAQTDILEPDNNKVENSIRPLAIGRKNYLFAGSHEAAQRGAMMYSLLGTCKANGIEPYAWLKDILENYPHNSSTESKNYSHSIKKNNHYTQTISNQQHGIGRVLTVQILKISE